MALSHLAHPRVTLTVGRFLANNDEIIMKMQKLLMVLLAIVLVSCVPLATATSIETPMPIATLASIPPTNSVVSTSTSEQPSPVVDLSKFAFPKSVDTTKHYLFYIHGRIIEEQGIPAVDPVFGEYEYQSILERLSSYGFVVISEQRVKNTDSIEYAKRIQEQVTILLNAGVPATNIIVVGASKGAYITIYASHFLENQEIKFVIMGICNSEIVADFKQNHIFLYGKVLSIYDSADYQYGGSCEELFTLSEGNEGLSRYDEIVLNIGTGHGILYKPLDEWITPVIQWARNP